MPKLQQYLFVSGNYEKLLFERLTTMKHLTLFLFTLAFLLSCSNSSQTKSQTKPPTTSSAQKDTIPKNAAGIRTVHVFVALCDNKYQGIVPVGKAIGNGQDPDNNLYWGCDNGVRTFFKKKSSDWVLVQSWKKLDSVILERLLFKHKTAGVYLLADAYDGQFIKQTTTDFLTAASGKSTTLITHQKDSLYFGGASKLLAYIGHDGLMDFALPVNEQTTDTTKRETIILACYSKAYFTPHIKAAGATPLLWTTNLMAPEAYTLHDALRSWVAGQPPGHVQEAAAQAYARYQHCSVKAAKNLVVWGW